jgi:hypothetical protein
MILILNLPAIHRQAPAADDSGNDTLSDECVEHFVDEVGVDRIWRALDRLTAPEMPLAAAE